jgi:hypothetical protein
MPQVKRLVCQECGKSCRSAEEWDLHSKRTGHAEFVDQTGTGDVVDTEAQMKAAAADEAGSSAEQGGGEAAAAAEEMVPAEVDAGLLQQLEEMVGGFS